MCLLTGGKKNKILREQARNLELKTIFISYLLVLKIFNQQKTQFFQVP